MMITASLTTISTSAKTAVGYRYFKDTEITNENDSIQFALFDEKGNQLTDYKYNIQWSSEFQPMFYEGVALVGKDGQYGFIDVNGNEITPFIYDTGSHLYSFAGFYEGLAWVGKDGKFGYIDTKLNEVIPFIYDEVGNFSEGLARVKKDDKWGYIDKKGDEVIPFIYTDSNGTYQETYDFSNGVTLVASDVDKYQLIDKNGNSVFTFDMNLGRAISFNNGIVEVLGQRSNGTWDIFYIDKTGNEVISPEDDMQEFDTDGIILTKEGEKCGAVDSENNIIIPCIYSNIEFVSDGVIYAAKDNYYNEIIYFDTSGNVICGDDAWFVQKVVTTELSVEINGSELTFSDQPPIIENGRTLVPVAKICEAMSAKVEWIEETRQVRATLGDIELIFTIDNPVMTINGVEKVLDQPPIIRNGRTLLPARAFAEELGATVDWDEETRTVIMTK